MESVGRVQDCLLHQDVRMNRGIEAMDPVLGGFVVIEATRRGHGYVVDRLAILQLTDL
jgi:hypothetical protein